MSIFVNQKELAEKKDIVNPNLAYGALFDAHNNVVSTASTKELSFSTSKDQNYAFNIFRLDTSFKKGDHLTISASADLTGDQINDGFYKASIFNGNYSKCYDDNQDSQWLKAGEFSSKTITVNGDSDASNPPIVLIYAGIAGQTGGNTITIKNLKVEKGTNATAWVPAEKDMVMQSDFDTLRARVDALSKQIGGVIASAISSLYRSSFRKVAM